MSVPLRLFPCCAVLLVATSAAAEPESTGMAAVPGGSFASVVPPAPGVDRVTVAPFELDRTPVTNGEFQAFVVRHPEWRRGAVAPLFADAGYLAEWAGPLVLGAGVDDDRPVTGVSWFAARAYCETRGARLPTWYEWEYAAAADATRVDARADPAYRQRMLDWYARPATVPPPVVGHDVADLYGIHDLPAGVWEWVEDFNALLVASDARDQDGADRKLYCGAGALTLQQKEQYAVLMRVAMLSALRADSTTRSLGFRCAR